jgi:hypothetical protein
MGARSRQPRRYIPVIALIVTFLAGYFAATLRERAAPLALAAPIPLGNGDINADGTLDITDAVVLLDYLFLAGPAPIPLQEPPAQQITALVVRHAEKEATGLDPCLTPDGQARAAHLRDILSKTSIGTIFATDACRTIQTVEPAAEARTLTIQKIAEVPAQVAALKALPPGSVALVAGHSFTIPDLMKGLGVAEPVTVPGTDFDNLWVVQFDACASVPASVVHLRY